MDDVIAFYRAELARVVAERDASVADNRKLWAAVGMLKGAAESLRATVLLVKEAAENDEFLRPGTLNTIAEDAVNGIVAAEKILGMSPPTS